MTGDDLRVARELIGIGRLDEARRVISGVLAERPDSADALATLAYLHHSTGDHARMLDVAVRAVQAGPTHPWARRLYALALLGTGRVAEAAEAADRCVELDPQDAAAHQVRAHALVRLGDRAPGYRVAAYRSALRAVDLAPDDADSYSTLARVLLAAGERSAARATDRVALGLAPDTPGPLRALAASDTLAGRFRASARAYRSLLTTHPTEAGLPHAFEVALDWLQALWAGLASVVAGVAVLLYVTGTPYRATAVTGCLGVWAVAYGYAHRGLAGAWWRYMRGRKDTRAALIALLVPLVVAGLFGFGPPDLPWLVVLAALIFYAIALMMPVGFLAIHLALAATAAHRRRRFRRDLGGPPDLPDLGERATRA